MSKNAISDLSKVLVNNIYSKTKDTTALGGSLIPNILLELVEADRELGGRGYPLEITTDSNGLVITSETTNKSESFSWDQVPKGDNKKDVHEFVERILREHFYS